MELFNEELNEKSSENISYNISEIYELSIDAFYAALYADMSELPIKAEIARFVEKVKSAAMAAGADSAARADNAAAGAIAAGAGNAAARASDAAAEADNAARTGSAAGAGNTADGAIAARAAADKAASDRGDPDVLVVLKTAQKVGHEIHRLMGLLRFSPDKNGVYIARCAPDYFILPVLNEHFSRRFGKTPWAIIDEKRGLCLYQGKIKATSEIFDLKDNNLWESNSVDHGRWEDLWKLYHRSVTNEGKKNTKLQKSYMPERYRKYLLEFDQDQKKPGHI